MKTISYHRKKFFFIPLFLVAAALFGFVTMLLWNALLPALFNFPGITFWQALGLLVLARLLFGGFHAHRGYRWPYFRMDPGLRNKIREMTPEEKREFFRKMHYERTVWHREHFNDNVSESGKQKKEEE